MVAHRMHHAPSWRVRPWGVFMVGLRWGSILHGGGGTLEVEASITRLAGSQNDVHSQRPDHQPCCIINSGRKVLEFVSK